MVSFQNQASLIEAGTLRVAVVAESGITCGSASWVLNVGPGQQFSQTQRVPLESGCSPADGTLVAEGHDSRVHGTPPPEAIP